MERIDYDPEIDPSIREEREAAQRERELTDRIRIEIERYVADNDLVPRAPEKPERVELEDEEADGETGEISDKKPDAGDSETAPGTPPKKRERKGRKAVQSIFTGTILTSEWMKKSWPYLLGFGAVLILYIGLTFQLQKWHLERQNLERQVRELSIEAVRGTAERVRQTRRSEIVKRLEANNIPLKEFPHPVKTIERE
jgi:hypothetical protein